MIKSLKINDLDELNTNKTYCEPDSEDDEMSLNSDQEVICLASFGKKSNYYFLNIVFFCT